MRISHRFPWAFGVALALGAVAFYGQALADHTEQTAKHEPLKALSHPFLDGLVGSWTTEATATYKGKESKGTGKATYGRAIGGTAIIQTYENSMPGPDGKTMDFHGHGINRVSDDGKTLTIHWFCNMFPDAMKLTGPITDSGFKLTGTSPHGGEVTVSFRKDGDVLTFTMTDGENQMTETYRRASDRQPPAAPASR